MQSGFLKMSVEEYHKDPCTEISLSQSIAHLMVSKSPQHAWFEHPKLGGGHVAPSDDMNKGTLIGALLLGRGPVIEVFPYDNYMSKAAREERDRCRLEGHYPVLQKHYDSALLAASAIRENFAKQGITLEGNSEQAFCWIEKDEEGKPVQCRGMMDQWQPPYRFIDLKKTECAHPKAVAAKYLMYGYDIQYAAYLSGLNKIFPENAGKHEGLFLFYEADPPYAVLPAEPTGMFHEIGFRKWRKAINTWSKCLQTNTWPSYSTGPVFLDAPTWALKEEDLEDERLQD